MLFLIFEKRDEQKISAGNFSVYVYAFFLMSKKRIQKTAPGILKIVSLFFWYLKNGWTKKLLHEF